MKHLRLISLLVVLTFIVSCQAQSNDKEKDDDLESPIGVKIVEKITNTSPQRRCQDVHRDKNCHPHPAKTMQDEGQHWALAFIAQGGHQTDVPRYAHECLLKVCQLPCSFTYTF